MPRLRASGCKLSGGPLTHQCIQRGREAVLVDEGVDVSAAASELALAM